MFVVTCFYFSFIMSQLFLSRTELRKCTLSILMYSCDHIICPVLSILYLYTTVHKAWIFEECFFWEAFPCDFKSDCILLWHFMFLNKTISVIRKISHFHSMINLYYYNPRVGINESCKFFIAALIYNSTESGHPQWTPTIRVKCLDKETIYFNFRLDIGKTNFNDMDEFDPVTKP